MLIERLITEKIITDSPMDLPKAVLHGVTTEGDTFILASQPDVYKLLDKDYSGIEGLIGLAVHTVGWCAPINPETGETDGRPSEHPERKRVALVATLTINGYCSGIKFENEEEVTYEEGMPNGNLWDALNKCLAKVRQVENGIETSSACSATLSKSSDLAGHFGGNEGLRA